MDNSEACSDTILISFSSPLISLLIRGQPKDQKKLQHKITLTPYHWFLQIIKHKKG